jgi:hypothetical protein
MGTFQLDTKDNLDEVVYSYKGKEVAKAIVVTGEYTWVVYPSLGIDWPDNVWRIPVKCLTKESADYYALYLAAELFGCGGLQK